MTSPLRGFAAAVLGLAACLLLPLTLTATWADGLVNDGDTYAQAVAPLSDDPALQQTAEQRITAAVTDNLDPAAAALLGDQLRPAVSKLAARAVESNAFDSLWLEANRTGHQRLLKALRSDSDKDVVIPLDSVVEKVVADLSPAGRSLTIDLPSSVGVTLLPGSDLPRARTAYDRLTAAATWLPWATVVAVLATLLVAVRRLRAGALVALGCTLTCAGLPLLLDAVRRTAVADAAGTAPASVRYAVYDALTEGLRHDAVVAAGVSGLVAVVAGLAALVVRRRA